MDLDIMFLSDDTKKYIFEYRTIVEIASTTRIIAKMILKLKMS